MRLSGAGRRFAAASLCILFPALAPAAASDDTVEGIVTQAVRPAMARYGIPGLAVGVVAGGATRLVTFGVASKDTQKPVDADTLFEIGSLSKTFTATLASEAAVEGRLALADSATRFLPELRGSALDKVSLLNLGTHTTGGMPLQFPDGVTTDEAMMHFFRSWTPAAEPGTVRTYANPSIGLLGLIAARAIGDDFDALMERRLFPALGLRHTYLHVPDAETAHYAQGYTKADVPIRMAPGMLAPEAYGVRTTAGDLLRFVEANMDMVPLDAPLRRAIAATHTGYYSIPPMTQDLVWEQYGEPVTLARLQAGNSTAMGSVSNPATPLEPPFPPREDVLIDKTGSTNGFGAYVAYVPGDKTGVVLLANKNFPIEARVAIVFEILARLKTGAPLDR